jgi:hypothetical protein
LDNFRKSSVDAGKLLACGSTYNSEDDAAAFTEATDITYHTPALTYTREPTPQKWPSMIPDVEEDLYIPHFDEEQMITLGSATSCHAPLSTLQHQADFFMSCGLWTEASRLYLILCRVYQRFRPIPRRRCLMSLATGVRCAILGGLPHDLIVLEEFVRVWLNESEKFLFTVFERWFLRILYIQVQKRQNNLGLDEAVLRFQDSGGNAPAFLEQMAHLLRRPDHDFRSFVAKVHTTFYLLNTPDRSFNSEHIDIEAVSTRFERYMRTPNKPIMLHRDDLIHDTKHIREYLDWILVEVASGFEFQVDFTEFRTASATARDADTAILFCFLCSRWIEGSEKRRKSSKESCYTTDTCHVIPELEIIKVLCIRIMRLHPTRMRFSKLNFPRNLIDKSWDLRRRAQAGAKALAEESDEVFMTTFLNYFTYYAWDKSNGMQQDAVSWLDPAISITFAKLFLPVDLSEIIEQSPLRPVEINVVGYDPKTQLPITVSPPQNLTGPFRARSTSMLAGTLSSSDLSSMRRMAKRGTWVSVSSWRSHSGAIDIDRLSEAFKVSTIDDASSLAK